MTSFQRFENRLPAMLDELAVPRLPDYADDLFARTAATRQRAGWTFPERWLPMSTITQRLAAAPRIPWRLGVVVALLAIAALVAALIAGSILKPRPAPYGPAENGKVIFADQSGKIVAGDPVTGTTISLGFSGTDPIYSQDGDRFAFTRFNAGAALWIGDVAGGDPVQISNEPISTPSFIGWSARGDRLLVVDAQGRMLLFGTARSGPPSVLNDALKVGPVAIGPGYNYRSTNAFRPPLGDEVAFVDASGASLMAARTDGTGLRTILDKKTSQMPFTRIISADWSPDGAKLLVMADLPERTDHWQLFVLNADGTGMRRIGANPLDGYNSPKWSPDGASIGFQYWTMHVNDDGQDFHGIGVLDLATGELRDLGRTQFNGFTTWEFSPDGKSILWLPGDGSDQISLVDIKTGTWTSMPWTSGSEITWQRTAK